MTKHDEDKEEFLVVFCILGYDEHGYILINLEI